MKRLFEFYKSTKWFYIVLVMFLPSLTIGAISGFFMSYYTQNIWELRILISLIFSILPFICCIIPNVKYSKLFENRFLMYTKVSIITYLLIFMVGFILSLFVGL